MMTIRRILPLFVLAAVAMYGCGGDENVTQITEIVAGPVVTAVSPSAGPPAGGTDITLSGTNFVDGATVEIGGVAAANVTVASDSEITATTPAGTAGPVTVKVTNPDGRSGSLLNGFTYADPPTLANVNPSIGTTGGGTTVTLTGTGFEPGACITFGTGPGAGVAYLSSTEITAVTPAQGAGSVDVAVTNLDGQSSTLASAFTFNDPPSFSCSLAADSILWVGESVSFTVTATDPEGDLVDLELVNPPPNCIMTPIRSATSPATATVNFLVPSGWGGYRTFLFQTRDSALPGRKILSSLPVQVLGKVSSTGIVIADVTGDGLLDTVGLARNADVSGITDTGAIYVWAGTTSPSSYPSATLTVSGAIAGDRLGNIGLAQGILCADVTGDGTLDIVAGAQYADILGVADTGAVYVWAGGSSLTGNLQPTAVLTVSGAVQNDLLGNIGLGQGILCADVTGDGTLDIVAGARNADVGGVTDTGAIYVWAGGSTLTGGIQPTAVLTVFGAAQDDTLGHIGSGQGIFCADVTGDGTLDIVAVATYADGALTDTGAVYVWAGGSSLTGDLQPTAVLTVSGAAADDKLGYLVSGQGVLCADVTGDGMLDIVAGARNADVGTPPVQDTGAIYVWAGGSTLTGALQPTAVLTVSGAAQDDCLGYLGSGQGILCADVTGDGTLDVVAGARDADVGTPPVQDAGAIYVWAGGSTLTGALQPTTVLTVSGATQDDELGFIGWGQGILCTDVTGDGTLDIVAGARYVDVAFLNTGAIFVWAGGSALTGNLQPTAVLTVSGAAQNDQLGNIGSGQGILCADVTGDGTLDIVAGARYADGALLNTGAIYIWAGGSSLAGNLQPTAVLTVSGAAQNDRLGDIGSGEGVLCADVTGNGTLDVVAGARYADGALLNTGAIYVWAGGSSLAGNLQPTAILTISGAATNDYLGYIGSGQGILCVDVTDDGTLDIVAGAYQADAGVVTDTGAVYVWAGGSSLTNGLQPTAVLTVSGAATNDYLGYIGSGQGILCADMTGDGTLDVVAGAWKADIGGVTDTGAIYVWSGIQWTEFSIPWAASGDQLGN